MKLCEQYADYLFLLNGEADMQMEELLSRPRQLPDYEKEIVKLNELVEAIKKSVGFSGDNQSCKLHLVEVYCADINERMHAKAEQVTPPQQQQQQQEVPRPCHKT